MLVVCEQKMLLSLLHEGAIKHNSFIICPRCDSIATSPRHKESSCISCTSGIGELKWTRIAGRPTPPEGRRVPSCALMFVCSYFIPQTDNLGIHDNCMKTMKGIIGRSTREGRGVRWAGTGWQCNITQLEIAIDCACSSRGRGRGATAPRARGTGRTLYTPHHRINSKRRPPPGSRQYEWLDKTQGIVAFTYPSYYERSLFHSTWKSALLTALLEGFNGLIHVLG